MYCTNNSPFQPECPDLEREAIYGITEEETVKSPLRRSEEKKQRIGSLRALLSTKSFKTRSIEAYFAWKLALFDS